MVCFLKLGGSLITEKAVPQTERPAVLARLAEEIALALAARPDLRLVLGHGSGSFGHSEAKAHGTQAGVRTPEEWQGFARVSAAAARLNRIVTDALLRAGVPALSLQPSASAVCRAGQIEQMAAQPVRAALEAGLAPLLYGDVAFDTELGGTIISTEAIFAWLARGLKPRRVLLAGLEAGIYADWPDGRSVLPRLTPAASTRFAGALGASNAPDVTGGMASKAADMLALVRAVPGLQALIFSGETPGNVFKALTEEEPGFGTAVCVDDG